LRSCRVRSHVMSGPRTDHAARTPHRATRGWCVPAHDASIPRALRRRQGPTARRAETSTVPAPRRSAAFQGRRLVCDLTTVAVHGSGAVVQRGRCHGPLQLSRRRRMAALQCGRPANRGGLHGAAPQQHARPYARGDQCAGRSASRPLRTHGWRDGACWAACSTGSPPSSAGTRTHPSEGPRLSAWRGPRSRQDPWPQTPAPNPRTAAAEKDEGRREGPDALRYGYDWNMRPARDVARPVGPVRRRARGWPGVDSLDGSSLGPT
jgi:hypothetical protein